MNLSPTFLRRGGVAVFVLFMLFTGQTVSAATLFSDGFESNNFSKWTEAHTGTLGTWRIDAARYTGKYSASVIGSTGTTDDILRKAFSTDTYKDATVSFFYKASSLDWKSKTKEYDQLFAEYSVDGKTWTLIKEINGQMTVEMDGSWRGVSVPVPSNKNFQLRFRAHLSDSGDRVWIDDVVISGTALENTLPRCTDGLDNDSDGYRDSEESECDAFYSNLEVIKEGTGEGTVVSSPKGILCGFDCVERYLASAVVTLTQTVERGVAFSGWGGACAGLGDCVVSMDNDKTVTANFAALPAYTLITANDAVEGGHISSSPSGITCGADCEEILYEGEKMSLSATPSLGYRFREWSGDCVGIDPVCELSALGNLFATAHYTKIPTYTLSVSNDPVTGGTIVSDPVGLISCGADCSQVLNEGADVAIKAIQKTGFVFDHWSGACSGTSDWCALTMEADKEATAHYTELLPGVCGNSTIEWDESCDDGNAIGGDGCSARCRIESWEMECQGTVSYPICRFVMTEI